MENVAHVFTQSLPSGPAARRVLAQDNEAPDAFWPDVLVQYSQDHPAPTKRENAQGRVLLEVFLILAAAAFLAFAVTFLLPGVSAQ